MDALATCTIKGITRNHRIRRFGGSEFRRFGVSEFRSFGVSESRSFRVSELFHFPYRRFPPLVGSQFLSILRRSSNRIAHGEAVKGRKLREEDKK